MKFELKYIIIREAPVVDWTTVVVRRMKSGGYRGFLVRFKQGERKGTIIDQTILFARKGFIKSNAFKIATEQMMKGNES